MTPRGINQREADVAQAFTRGIDKTIELDPELVLIAGDVFHQVRPTNAAILKAWQQFSRLRTALPNSEVVMIAGNHDTPRSTDTACILRLFEPLGFNIVDGAPQSLDFPDLDLSVLAVAMNQHPEPLLVPSGTRRWNVLTKHGVVEGMLGPHSASEELWTPETLQADLHPEAWDYIGLGHYHVFKQVSPNQFYSGATEYTSNNTWSERNEQDQTGVPGSGKGIIEYDLAARTHEFHALELQREFVDLDPVDARGRTDQEVNELIQLAADAWRGGIDEKVVRLVVRNLPRHVLRQLDHKMLRDLRHRAMHFHLDARRPDIISRSSGHGAPGRRPSLADFVRDKLRERVLPPDVDRDALVDLGARYLKDAEDREGASAAVPGSGEL